MAWYNFRDDDENLSILPAATKSAIVPSIVSAPASSQQGEFIPADAGGGMLFHPYNQTKKGRMTPAAAAKIFTCNAMFWAAVQQIVKPAQSARLVLREKSGDSWTENNSHPIIKWWRDAVNPEMNGTTFITATIVHLAVYGMLRAEYTPENAEAPDHRDKNGVIIPGGSLDAPWLTPVNPDILRPDVRKEIKFTSTNRVIIPDTNPHGKLYRYVHVVNAKSLKGYPVAIEDVFVMSNYNPERGYAGISPLELLDDMLGMGGSLIKHTRQYLGNNCLPSMFFKYTYDSSKGDMVEIPHKERTRFVEDFMRLFSLGGERPSTPAFLPGNTDVETVTPELKSVLPAELWDIVQSAVHEVLGTSAVESLVGLRHAKNTGAGTKSHQTSVWTYTVEPLLHFISDNLGQFLFQKFDGGKEYEKFINGDIELAWDFSRVPAWREIQNEHQKLIVAAWQDAAPVSVNEYRAALGLSPLDDCIGKKLAFEVVTKKQADGGFANNNNQNNITDAGGK